MRSKKRVKSLSKEGRKGIYQVERVGTAVAHMPCDYVRSF